MLWVVLLFVVSVASESPIRPIGSSEVSRKPPACPRNEYYEYCPSSCPRTDGCERLFWSRYRCRPDKRCNQPAACRCKPGFFRNRKGRCVTRKECTLPKPPHRCPKNEYYEACPPNCPPSDGCEQLWSKIRCDPKPGCKLPAGCRCLDGFYRNSNGKCVTSQECSGKRPLCGFNETFVPCRTICPPQSCSLPYTDYICLEKFTCQPGCDCIEGHWRNSSGICVLSKDCDAPGTVTPKPEPPKPMCPENEYYDTCPPTCPRTDGCEQLWSKIKCVPEVGCTIPAKCRCNDGFFRNSDGKCVTGKECSSGPVTPKPGETKCSANETIVECKDICPPRSCDISYTTYGCNKPIPCIKGCDCKTDYLRNSSGICVFNNDCTGPSSPVTPKPDETKCSANETIVECKDICPPRSCNISYTTYICNKLIPCIKGCDCKTDYLRNSSGICVFNNDCTGPPVVPIDPEPVQCGYNEELVPCKITCPPRDCEAEYLNYLCAYREPNDCQPGCECIQGHSRNKSGICIPVSECPPAPWIVVDPITPTPPIKEPPGPVDDTTTTTTSTTTTAPTKPCMQNEVYLKCKVDCSTQYCPKDDRRINTICEPASPCSGGCACRVGFRRKNHKNNTCIPSEDCPPVKCTRPNEVWNSCPSPCSSDRCEDAKKPPVICNTLIKNCQPQCVCKKGHYRNSSDICVPAAKCPPPPTTPTPTTDPPVNQCYVNETYARCRIECPKVYCPTNEHDALLICEPPRPCPSGCVCKDSNHRRRSKKDRTCIPIEECPTISCSKPNEVWHSCPSSCLMESCKDANKPKATCFEKRRFCQPKCICAKGHYRNDSFVCVPAEQCTPITSTEPPTTITSAPTSVTTEPPMTTTTASSKPQCKVNETNVFCTFKCPHHFCPANDERTKYACKPPRNCPSGCGCEMPYKYKSYDDLTCVLAEDCPPVECTRPNEEWNRCTLSCFNEFCQNADAPKALCYELDTNCEPACACKKGFFRNKLDICVPKAECTPTTSTEPPTTTTSAPSESQCKGNETIVFCSTFKCPTQFCPKSDSKLKIACKPPRDCPSGCGCKIPYRYKSSKDLSCILAEDCPPVTCTRPNEEWAPCPSGCLDQSCDNIYAPPSVCNELLHNCQPQCICKKGFYRNKDGVCISQSECVESKCNANETYVPCTFDCPTNFCARNEYDSMIACSPPYPCNPGCVCKKSNQRRRSYEDRTCIPIGKCPPVTCSKPNEVWNTCPSPCLAESCDDANKPKYTCLEKQRYCAPKCVCAKGYYRNESFVCVPASECPSSTTEPLTTTTTTPTSQPQCGVNETVVDCTFKCPYHYCPVDDGGIIYACKPPRDCPSGCGCALGYRFKSIDDPTCILAEDCPSVECTRPNEEWATCPSGCLDESCKNSDAPPAVCNELVHNCQPKCVCKSGFYRNETDVCIPKDDCKKCKVNERYVWCKAGCPTDFCPTDDSRGEIACDPPYPCPGGCICDLNYKWRSYEDQTCILASDCPPINCTRPNEVWSPCPSPCLIETCDNARRPAKTCNYLVQNCQPKCICDKGYFRNRDDICVPSCQCPPPQNKVISP